MSTAQEYQVWTPDSGIPPPPGWEAGSPAATSIPPPPGYDVWTPDSGIPPPPGYMAPPPEGELPAPVVPEAEKPPKKRSWWEWYGDTMRDTGVVMAKGVVGAQQAVTGLADMMPITEAIPGGPLTRLAAKKAAGLAGIPVHGWSGWAQEKLGLDHGEAQQILHEAYSPEAQEAFRELADAKGILEKTGAALRNPETILLTVGESLPTMALGGAIGKTLEGGGVLAKYGYAAGEGLVSAGAGTEETRAQSPSGFLTERQVATHAVSGILTAVIGALGGRAASKLEVGDWDKLMAGNVSQAIKQNIIYRAVVGAIVEGSEETAQSVQEQIASNLANGRPWYEGWDQAAVMGWLTGMTMGGGMSLAGGKPAQTDRERLAALPLKLAKGGTVSREDAKAWTRATGQELPTDQAERTRIVNETFRREFYDAYKVPEDQGITKEAAHLEDLQRVKAEHAEVAAIIKRARERQAEDAPERRLTVEGYITVEEMARVRELGGGATGALTLIDIAKKKVAKEAQDAEAVQRPEEEVREVEGRKDIRRPREVEVRPEPTGEEPTPPPEVQVAPAAEPKEREVIRRQVEDTLRREEFPQQVDDTSLADPYGWAEYCHECAVDLAARIPEAEVVELTGRKTPLGETHGQRSEKLDDLVHYMVKSGEHYIDYTGAQFSEREAGIRVLSEEEVKQDWERVEPETVAATAPPKEGDTRTDEFGVEQVYRMVDPNTVGFTEPRKDVEQHPSVDEYTRLAQEGSIPPPVDIVWNEDEGRSVTSNRRRVMAAQRAGTLVPAWVDRKADAELFPQAITPAPTAPQTPVEPREPKKGLKPIPSPETPPAATQEPEGAVTLYHGTKADYPAGEISGGRRMFGIHLSTDETAAAEYGSVRKYVLDPAARTLNLTDDVALWEFMRKHELLDADELANPDLRQYVEDGRLFQYDLSSSTQHADDVAQTAKDLGYDMVTLGDDLGGKGGNVAYVVVNEKVLLPAIEETPPVPEAPKAPPTEKTQPAPKPVVQEEKIGRKGVTKKPTLVEPSPEQNIREYAKDAGLDAENLLSAAEEIHQAMKDDHETRISAKRAAHKKTGLSGLDMHRLENKGYDRSSSEKVGGKTGEKLRYFDAYATELASDYPEVFPVTQDPSEVLWNLLREPPIEPLRMDNPHVMAEAEAMVRSTIEVAPKPVVQEGEGTQDAEVASKWESDRQEVVIAAQRMRRAGLNIAPKTERGQTELFDRLTLETGVTNEAILQSALDMVAAEPKGKAKESVSEPVVQEGEGIGRKGVTKGPSKPLTKLQQAAKKATQEAADELDAFGKMLKGKGLAMNPMFDPEVIAGVAKLTAKFVKAGTLNFASFIEQVVATIGQAATDRIRPVLESEWEKLRQTGEVPGMEPAVDAESPVEATLVEEPKAAPEGEGTEARGLGLPTGTEAPSKMVDAGIIPRFFRARGNLPKQIKDAIVGMFSKKRVAAIEVRFILVDLKAVAKQYGYSLETVNEAFAGERTLPSPKAQTVVDRMRATIDGMTDEMLDQGLFHPDIEADVRARKGHYFRRSYEIFSNPNFQPEPAKEKALRAWLEHEHPKWTKGEVDGAISNLKEWPKEAGSMAEAFSKAGFNKMANEIFKRRKKVPKVLREFWGEEKDPRVNFAMTAASMSDVLAKHAMLKAFVEAGEGRWFHPKPINTSDGMFDRKVPATLPVRLDPTKPLYTSKEILQSLQDIFGPHSRHPWLGILNAVAKWGKTVGSLPATHVRNYLSWYFLHVSEGNIFFTGLGRAHKTTFGELFGTTDEALRAEVIDGAKYGVTGRGAKAGELAAQIREAMGTNWESWLPKPAAIGLKGVTKAYQSEDDVGKVTSWFYNRYLYANALGKSVHDPEIKQRAAEIVQNTTPTYDMAPEIVQLWRRNPLVGPFVVWPAEMIRIHANRITLAAEEMRTPGLRAIGVRRAGAMLASQSALYGGGLSLLSLLWAGVDDDDDKHARTLMAPWDQDAVLLWTSYDKETGTGTYINLSYTIPSAMFAEPIIAVIKGDPEVPAIQRASRSILKDFFGPELGLAAAGEAVFNKKLTTGQPIAPDNAEFVDQVIKRGGHILLAIMPNTINILNRVYKGYVGHESEWKKYDFGTEVGAGMGVRFSTFDADVAVQWRAKTLQKAKGQSGYEFRRAINALSDYDEGKTRKAFAKGTNLREKAYRVAIGHVAAAKHLGRSGNDVALALKKGGVAEKHWAYIWAGRIPPMVASDIEVRVDRIANRDERIKLRDTLVDQYNTTLDVEFRAGKQLMGEGSDKDSRDMLARSVFGAMRREEPVRKDYASDVKFQEASTKFKVHNERTLRNIKTVAATRDKAQKELLWHYAYEAGKDGKPKTNDAGEPRGHKDARTGYPKPSYLAEMKALAKLYGVSVKK